MHWISVAVALAVNGAGSLDDNPLRIEKRGTSTVLSLGKDSAFRITNAKVESARGLRIGDSNVLVATWNEVPKGLRATATPYYAISLDGAEVQRTTSTTYTISTWQGDFDPVKSPAPVPTNLTVGTTNETYLVQFVTQPLSEYFDAIKGVGGTPYSYFPYNSYAVRLSPSSVNQVRAMPFVRAVVPFHPGFKLSRELVAQVRSGTVKAGRYNIGVFAWGDSQKRDVANYIRLIGGTPGPIAPEGQWFEATLTPDQLDSVIRMSEVMYVGIAAGIGVDMDIVHAVGGANLIESTYGFTGQGVRAEVMDGGVRQTHAAFASRPIIFHRSNTVDTFHGTNTTGIVFGDGSGNPAGRGMLPAGQPIFANYNTVAALGTRFAETAELVASPYFAVFQSNSWGHNTTTTYDEYSSDMDDILWRNDILIFNSQSNTGNQNSRPEAWAKNIVSVGGISHFNTATRADDAWTSASIGPSLDGRIKPDISYFYDNILCPTDTTDTAYNPDFNGTSAATPIAAGHAGIMYQMWSNGWLYNSALANTVFDNRPKATLMKAMLMNTAFRYAFTGSGANLGRYRQGYGTPDLGNLHNLVNISGQLPRVMWVNEEHPLTNLQTRSYRLWVPTGTPEFRVTMAYSDPPGTPNSPSIDRVNDLTLRVTSPSGTIYYGNNGLADGNVSTPGGSPNTVDTVENVFIASPQSGAWTVEVIGSDINTDARLETPGVVDADYSLFAAGAQWTVPITTVSSLRGRNISGSLADTLRSDNVRWSLDGRDPINETIGAVSMETQIVVPGGTLSKLRLRIEGQVVEPNTRLRVYLLQQSSSESLELVANQPMTSSDSLITIEPGGNVNRFVGGGRIIAYFVWRREDAGPDLTLRIDQIRLDCEP